MDQLLEQMGLRGVKYEDLTKDEKISFNIMLESKKNDTLTIDKIRDHLADMRATVESELTKWNLSKEQDLFLKARLRNIILFEAFLSTPERARRALERMRVEK